MQALPSIASASRAPPLNAKPLARISGHHSVRRLHTSCAAGSDAAAEWEGDVCRYRRSHEHHRVEAPPDAPPIVLLPGFGNNSSDYTAPFGNEEAGIAAALQRRGFRVYVLPLTRQDWFKVGRSIFTRGFWANPPTLTTHPGYSWYLERVKELVDRARLETGAEQVDIVAHSAGGWLGRAFIGQEQYKEGANLSADTLGSGDMEPHPAVRALVTLGSPHSAPPPDKIKDMTGGASTWTDSMWPGAFFADQGLKYVCVAGRAVRGNREPDRRTLSGYSYGSYEQVCGEGHEVEGDAVVPLRSALLDGSNHVVLDGVFHSMSRIRTFNEPAEVPWYGSEDVLDAWLHHLV